MLINGKMFCLEITPLIALSDSEGASASVNFNAGGGFDPQFTGRSSGTDWGHAVANNVKLAQILFSATEV